MKFAIILFCLIAAAFALPPANNAELDDLVPAEHGWGGGGWGRGGGWGGGGWGGRGWGGGGGWGGRGWGGRWGGGGWGRHW